MNGITIEENRTGENLQLQVRKVIRASRQRVFDAWTRPETIRQWFGPGQIEISSADVDARIGGTYRMEMQGTCDEIGNPSPRNSVSGKYLEVEPYDRLVFTWKGSWDPTEETLVTVDLKDVEGGTEILLTHERFTSTVSRDKHNHGWTGSLEKLAHIFAR